MEHTQTPPTAASTAHTNGEHKPTYEELLARLQTAQSEIAAKDAQLKIASEGVYKILEPADRIKQADGKLKWIPIPNPPADAPRTLSMTCGGGKSFAGGRAKFLAIIDEVKSGRLEAFLKAHPEIK